MSKDRHRRLRELYQLHISIADDAKPVNASELSAALVQLAKENPRAAEVVELKFLGGLTGEEVAERLSVSRRTVNTDWRFAKAWLYERLSDIEVS